MSSRAVLSGSTQGIPIHVHVWWGHLQTNRKPEVLQAASRRQKTFHRGIETLHPKGLHPRQESDFKEANLPIFLADES